MKNNAIPSLSSSKPNKIKGRINKIQQKAISSFIKKSQLPSVYQARQSQNKRHKPNEDLNREYDKVKMMPIAKSILSPPLVFNKSHFQYRMLKDLNSINKPQLSKDFLSKLKPKIFNIDMSEPTSAEEKPLINKIDILYQCEKASVVLQKHWRGWTVRHKYEKYKYKRTKKGSQRSLSLNLLKPQPSFSLSVKSEISNISINSQELNYSSESSDYLDNDDL